MVGPSNLSVFIAPPIAALPIYHYLLGPILSSPKPHTWIHDTYQYTILAPQFPSLTRPSLRDQDYQVRLKSNLKYVQTKPFVPYALLSRPLYVARQSGCFLPNPNQFCFSNIYSLFFQTNLLKSSDILHIE